MKKIFLILAVLMFSVVIVSFTKVEAADVPGFYQVGSKYLTFTGREDTRKGCRVYGYDCDVDLQENFAERFMYSLIKNYNFRLIGHYVNDYRRGQAKYYERWVFVYTGSKRVSTFEHKNMADRKNPYYCHLVVGRSKDWNSGITHFSIRISYDLSYGED